MEFGKVQKQISAHIMDRRVKRVLLNMMGFAGDIALVLISCMIRSIVPKKVKPQVKRIVNHILAIEDSPKPENKCYAVQVFDFPLEKKIDKPGSAHMSKLS